MDAHTEESTTWVQDRRVTRTVDYKAYAGHPAVDKLQDEYLPALAELDPDSPFVVASFGHEKEKSMTIEKLREILPVPDDHIIPIHLDDKADGMRVLHKLFALNNIDY